MLSLSPEKFAALEVLTRAAHAEADRDEMIEMSRYGSTQDPYGLGRIIHKLEKIRAGL